MAREETGDDDANGVTSEQLSVVEEEIGTRSVEFSEQITEIPSGDNDDDHGGSVDEQDAAGSENHQSKPRQRWSILSYGRSRQQNRRNTVQINTLAGEVKFFEKVARAAPRTYFFLFFVVIPLFGLIGFCFVFGYGLAKLESREEINSNDDKLRAVYDTYQVYVTEQERIRDSVQSVYPRCLSDYDDNVTFSQLEAADSNIFPALNKCSNAIALLENPIKGGAEFYEDYPLTLDFNWMNCRPAPLEILDDSEQPNDDPQSIDQTLLTIQYKIEFYNSYLRNLDATMASNTEMTEEEASPLAMQMSTGSEDCQVSAAKGAFFFFAVLTTIGDSQAVPTTTGGRALVYSFGFASIIAFVGLLAQAGYVTVTIVDHFLKRRLGLPFLTRGFGAVILWFCALICYMLILSGCYIGFMDARSISADIDVTMREALWFSFMSMTTVGVLDNFPPPKFVAEDMFLLPLVILFGFVFVVIFAFKLTNFFSELLPRDLTLEELLEKEYLRQDEGEEDDDQQREQEEEEVDDDDDNDQQYQDSALVASEESAPSADGDESNDNEDANKNTNDDNDDVRPHDA